VLYGDRIIIIMMNAEKIEKPMSVMYVVVSGEYSDFKIVSLWSSKEAARAECELLDGSGLGYDFRVQEWFSDVSTLDGARREVEGYRAVLRPEDISGEPTVADVEVKRNTFVGEYENSTYHSKGHKNYKAFVSAYSATEEEAVNLALEKFAEVKGKTQ
jgi:hypothetical protein